MLIAVLFLFGKFAELRSWAGHARPTCIFAIRAATIARWLSSRCRRRRFKDTTNPSGSMPSYAVVRGVTFAARHAGMGSVNNAP